MTFSEYGEPALILSSPPVVQQGPSSTNALIHSDDLRQQTRAFTAMIFVNKLAHSQR